MKSKIGTGTIRHRRYKHSQHEFKYNLFMMYLDLDEINTVFNDYWLWSYNRFNVASLKRKKYLNKLDTPLLKSVKDLIFRKTKNAIDKVFLLTNLAYFGYCFNPISLYFCMKQGKLINCIVEVSNTPWGEMHHYILTPQFIKNNTYEMRFVKKMHVSPFLGMDYTYHLRCSLMPQHISIHIENTHNGIRDFDATLNLSLQPINSRNLRSALIKFPWMSAKTICAIYWQALKLLLKRVPIIKHRTTKL